MRILLPGLILLAMVPALSSAADSAEEFRLKQLRQQIDSLQETLAQTRDERSELNRQLELSEQAIGQLAQSLRTLDAGMHRQRQKLHELQQRESAQIALLERERRALAYQVKAAYATGRQERLKILFNQQDPDRVSRMMAYFDYLNRARAARMQEIENQLRTLRETQASISREEAELQNLKQQRLAEKRTLEQTQATRQQLIASLSADLRESGRELEELQQNERRLEKLLAGIQQALQDSEAAIPGQVGFNQRKGELPWPAKGIIRAFFGTPKIGSLRWDGVMIGAPEGREIHAVHPGRVAYADWLRGFGLLLIIDHGDGYMTLYGHNQSLFKETGDWVEAGEAVALIGSSGGRDKAGVYFGIRYKGKPVNPTKWCKKRKGRRVGALETGNGQWSNTLTSYRRLS